jgi:hypothetical protein
MKIKHGTCENGSYGNKNKLYKTEDLHTGNTNINNLNMGKYRQDYTHCNKQEWFMHGHCNKQHWSK